MPNTGAFHPYRVVSHAEARRLEEPPPQMNPHGERGAGNRRRRILSDGAVPAVLRDLLCSTSPRGADAGDYALV